MKFYLLALSLCLPLLVGAQTIPYQLDLLNLQPDGEPDVQILELAAVGSKLYWAVDGDINYITNGTVDATLSFEGGIGLRDGIVPLGNIGDLYYFHYRSGNKGYNAVIDARLPIPAYLSCPCSKTKSILIPVPSWPAVSSMPCAKKPSMVAVTPYSSSRPTSAPRSALP